MKRKYHINVSEHSQFSLEIHSYKLSIQYLGFFFPIFFCIANSDLALPATVFSLLYVRLQYLWLLLMAVYSWCIFPVKELVVSY